MTRAVLPGSIQAAVRAAYHAVGGIEAAGVDLGLSISTLSYGTEVSEQRPGGLGVAYLDRLGRMSAPAAEPLARHFAQLAQGVFCPLDLGGVTAADINAVTREFADVLDFHAKAHSDASPLPGDYTRAEALDQARELAELAEAAMKLRAALMARAGER